MSMVSKPISLVSSNSSDGVNGSAEPSRTNETKLHGLVIPKSTAIVSQAVKRPPAASCCTVQEVYLDLNLKHIMPKPLRTDFGIGVVGAGFIMRDVQLKAYADAGFKVVGITSRTPENARAVADLRGISKTYQTMRGDVAGSYGRNPGHCRSPDQQLSVIRQAVEQGAHLKGMLAQKPLAVNYADACEIVRLCRERGLPLAVNQNMRHDQSIRALKTILTRQYLGTNVLATIDMRAVPHWQPWAQGYERLTLLIMSVHHLDAFRYLFGEPEAIYVSARKDPRTDFPHQDGICFYVLEYADGFRASLLG